MNYETYTCGLRGVSWRGPARDDKESWELLFSKAEGFIPEMGMINWLREQTDFSELEIKNLVGRIVLTGTKCYSCAQSLLGRGFVECANCGEINYLAGKQKEAVREK